MMPWPPAVTQKIGEKVALLVCAAEPHTLIMRFSNIFRIATKLTAVNRKCIGDTI
jgi:hypothetical protein